MFHQLMTITKKPELYSCYTAEALWNHPYISKQMLKAHLDPNSDNASRNWDFIASSAAFLRDRFGLEEGKSVVDFGCGPGLYTTRFAQMGCKVQGLDFSQNSLAYARNEAERLGLDIQYRYQNYLDYQPTEKYDLATMIFCDYCALNDSQRQKLLNIMRNSLKAEGHLFIDVCTEKFFDRIEEGISLSFVEKDGFWSPSPYFELISAFKYPESRVSLEKYTVVEANGTFEIFNWLKHYTPEELSIEFRDNGLEIIEMYPSFGDNRREEESEVIAAVAKLASNPY